MADQPGDSHSQSLTFWRRTTRVLQVAFAVGVVAAVWLLGFSGGSEPAPLLPDTETAFSLDLKVVDTVDHGVIYAVEQRARPYYRIFSVNPRTGEVATVFSVPEDAIVYGMALNPDADTLALAYSTDFAIGGSGIWTIDLSSGELSEVVPAVEDLYLTDVTWSPEGDSILSTHVDRRGSEEVLSIARISLDSASVEVLAEDAINPFGADGAVYYLNVDEGSARRSVGVIGASGSVGTIQIGDGSYDLDHLIAGPKASTVRVAILETVEGGVTFGEPAAAHGNHDVASTWWTVATNTVTEPTAVGLDPIIVYDAASDGETIVYATNEGLSIGAATRTDLIKSRAIRFVAY